MCDEAMEDIEQIIQQTQPLNVADTHRRRIRHRQWRQDDDVVEGDEKNP